MHWCISVPAGPFGGGGGIELWRLQPIHTKECRRGGGVFLQDSNPPGLLGMPSPVGRSNLGCEKALALTTIHSTKNILCQEDRGITR